MQCRGRADRSRPARRGGEGRGYSSAAPARARGRQHQFWRFIYTTGLQALDRIAVNPDVKPDEAASLVNDGLAQCFAVPAEMANLLEPLLLGDTGVGRDARRQRRSEEHTSELQSLMRISSAVFCLKTKKNKQ